MHMKIKHKKSSTFDYINIIFMIVLSFIILYPIWYTLIYSLNSGTDSLKGPFYWWPRDFTLDNYLVVFNDSTILKGFAVSIARTVIGTTLHVFFTAMVAYSFSKTNLIGRKLYMTMGTITLFVSGGLIPNFLLFRSLNLLDNFFVYIIPGAFSFFDLLIFTSFFAAIPESIEESAKIDGANDFLIFIKLILPLSGPVLATIVLFNGVYNWNDYFMGIMFITRNMDLQPIATYLYKIVATTQAYTSLSNIPAGIGGDRITPQAVRTATMIVTTVPIVCIYPFLQKHFTKGILLGSVKG